MLLRHTFTGYKHYAQYRLAHIIKSERRLLISGGNISLLSCHSHVKHASPYNLVAHESFTSHHCHPHDRRVKTPILISITW